MTSAMEGNDARPMTSPTPKTEPFSDGDLIASLDRALAGGNGTGASVLRLSRRVSEYCSSFTIEELEVELSDGEALSLAFKNLSWSALIKEALSVKPEFLYDPLREIEMYRSVLTPCGWGTARYYGCIVDPPAGGYGLFLEFVPGEKLRFIGDFEVWRGAARWLARMHAAFALDPGWLARVEAAVRPIPYDAAFYARWMDRALVYLRRIESDRNREGHERFRRLAERYAKVASALAELPRTLLHGDYFPSNLLVVAGGGAPRICPVDWELIALGPGPVDVAALTAGGWTESEKEDLARCYYEEMVRSGAPIEPYGVFTRSLALCRLHLAVQWLGWSTDWTPPSEERQDWLQEALHVADALGLSG